MRQDTETQVGQKWMLYLGVLFTLAGIGFFLKYAFDQNWVGPWVRVALGYGAGGLFLAGGGWAKRKGFGPFGLALMGGGFGILYLTTWASLSVYHLTGHVPAFVLMVLITLAALALSLRHDHMSLAFLGAAGGFAAPFLTWDGQDHFLPLFSYVSLLDAGVLALAFFKRWKPLTALGLAATWIIFAVWRGPFYSPDHFWPVLSFLLLFFLVFEIAPLALHLAKDGRARLEGFALTYLNSFAAFGFLYALVEVKFGRDACGLAAAGFGLFFLVLSFLFPSDSSAGPGPSRPLLWKGSFFLALASLVYFSDHWITLFWALQIILLVKVGRHLKDPVLCGGAAVLMIYTLFKWFFLDLSGHFHADLSAFQFQEAYSFRLLERWATGASVLFALQSFGTLLGEDSPFPGTRRDFSGILPWVCFGALWFFLSLEVGGYFHEAVPKAHSVSLSVLWALFAAGLMVLGFIRRKTDLRLASLVLFGITLLKVIFLDMSHAETPFRILSFIVSGLLLIGASYLYHRFAGRLATEQGPTKKGKDHA